MEMLTCTSVGLNAKCKRFTSIIILKSNLIMHAFLSFQSFRYFVVVVFFSLSWIWNSCNTFCAACFNDSVSFIVYVLVYRKFEILFTFFHRILNNFQYLELGIVNEFNRRQQNTAKQSKNIIIITMTTHTRYRNDADERWWRGKLNRK